MKTVREFVIDYLQKEYAFPDGTDKDTINYVESGYIDSIGLIKFVVELEDEFGIEFTNEELASPDFKITGGLIKLAEEKAKSNENT